MKLAVGIAIVAAHVAAFVALARRSTGTELVVDLDHPGQIASRVTIDDDDGAPPGAGLHRRRWTVRYRGGFDRAVGAAALVGPFQDPASPPCSGRVIIGQRLLDDGVAPVIAAALTAELRGDSVFPVGDFERVAGLHVTWAQLAGHPDDRDMIGSAPRGYVRAVATIVFERVEVPLVVALVPTLAAGALHFRTVTRAALAFDNRFAQWASNHLGGDRLATRLARRQLAGALVDALAPPPPFELSPGHTLRFGFCGEGPELVERAYAALPFAVSIGTLATAPALRPPVFPRGPFAPVTPTTRVAIDLDINALDGLLFELWRTGYLDQQLAVAGLDRRFNADPTVADLLSVRVSPLRLSLPPVVVAVGDHLRLSAEAKLAIADGAASTTGRLWGGLDIRWAGAAPRSVDLSALELSCERTPTTLVPCYADLVAALRGRAADLHGALTTALGDLIASIFVDRRLAADALPASLVIRGVTTQLVTRAPTATLRLELDAVLAR